MTKLDADSLAALVDRAAIVNLPPGAVDKGSIKDPAQVSFAIQTALKQAGVSGYGAVLGIATPDATVARIRMSTALKDSEWASAFLLEGKGVSPRLQPAETAISIQPIADVAVTSDKRPLIVAGALSKEVETLAKTARTARVAPRAIDLSAAATVRCLARMREHDTDVATIVDIGASKTTVVTRQGVSLRSVRTFDYGGDDITRAILGALPDITYDDAERRKHASRIGTIATPDPVGNLIGYGDDDDAPDTTTAERDEGDKVTAAVTAAADQLIEQIVSAVEQDAGVKEHALAPTQGIALCGGGALLRGLPERVSARVGVTSHVGRPWATLLGNTRGTASVYAATNGDEAAAVTRLATAIGLAMWTWSR